MRKPGPAPIVFTLSASGLNSTAYVEDMQCTYDVMDFNRPEFLHSRLQNSMDETNFSKPIIVVSATNAPVQVGIESCGFSNAVPLGPETTDNLKYYLSRFNISRFTVIGAPSSPSNILAIVPVANEHKRRLDYFKAYLARVQENISYQDLLAFRNDFTFPYLTATGLSASGLDINVSNCILTDFKEGTVHFTPSTQTARTIGWSATVEVWTYSSRLTF